MLKKKEFYFYKILPIPSIFVVETASYPFRRFATKLEIKKTLKYFVKRKLDNIAELFKIIAGTNTLVYNTKGRSSWHVNNKSLSAMDEHIRDKGAIVDQEGGIHSTASSYKDYLKRNDLVIKDWADGSNRKAPALSNRNEISRLVEKVIGN